MGRALMTLPNENQPVQMARQRIAVRNVRNLNVPKIFLPMMNAACFCRLFGTSFRNDAGETLKRNVLRIPRVLFTE
jgi:hypothetical protein